MEKMLSKIARQLDSLDEASLMSLWSKYASLTSAFEPTRRWEESALIFSLIQAKRWKNQLFNYHWSQQSRPRLPVEDADFAPNFTLEPAEEKEPPKCRVLAFTPSFSAPEDRADVVPGDGDAADTEERPDKGSDQE